MPLLTATACALLSTGGQESQEPDLQAVANGRRRRGRGGSPSRASGKRVCLPVRGRASVYPGAACPPPRLSPLTSLRSLVSDALRPFAVLLPLRRVRSMHQSGRLRDMRVTFARVLTGCRWWPKLQTRTCVNSSRAAFDAKPCGLAIKRLMALDCSSRGKATGKARQAQASEAQRSHRALNPAPYKCETAATRRTPNTVALQQRYL